MLDDANNSPIPKVLKSHGNKKNTHLQPSCPPCYTPHTLILKAPTHSSTSQVLAPGVGHRNSQKKNRPQEAKNGRPWFGSPKNRRRHQHPPFLLGPTSLPSMSPSTVAIFGTFPSFFLRNWSQLRRGVGSSKNQELFFIKSGASCHFDTPWEHAQKPGPTGLPLHFPVVSWGLAEHFTPWK